MMESPLHSTPRPRDVLLEQVRSVGFALRWPAVAVAALVGLLTLLAVRQILRGDEVIEFHPEHFTLPGLVGLLLPIGVWMGEERFGPGLFWTLPVDRRRHALARVCAGWVWLMAAVALFVVWLLALALLSGDRLLAAETIRLLRPAFHFPAQGTLGPHAWQTVRWMPEPLLWLTPFTGATGAYLLASGLALGARYPLRWIVGTLLGLFLLPAVGEATGTAWLADAPVSLLQPLLFGPYGFDTLLAARTDFLKVGTTLATGESVEVWRGLPDVGQWAAATLLWTGAGLAALWAAASRHREGRRP